MDNLGLALELLGVGMITVFIILSLVVVVGSLIIRFVNRYIPVEAAVISVAKNKNQGVNAKKVAAIVSAVKIVTSGKGKVTNIEKI